MIIYFSGTGNSYSVASKLRENGEKLVSVFDEKSGKYEDERIGFVYPEYCSGLPPKMREFMEKSEFNAKYFFAVATCGASYKASLGEIKYYLKEKGKNLNYVNKLIMPDSCVLLAFPPSKVERLLASETERVNAIREDLNRREINTIRVKKPRGAKNRLVWFLFGSVLGVYRKKSTENCVSCGKCVKACKANNITLESGKVSFGNNCYECFACINACPKNAIRFGAIKATDKKRYTHPCEREEE